MLAAIDNWIFLLLIAGAALLRLLASKATSSTTQQGKPDNPIRKPPQPPTQTTASSDEEQIRKFLEALGQPRGANVPPPIPPRTDVAPRPVAPIRPPRTMIPVPKAPAQRRQDTLGEQPAGLAPASQPKRIYQPIRPIAPLAESPIFEVRDTTASMAAAETLTKTETKTVAQPGDATGQPPNLARLLQTADGLRTAIILREIFSAPRSLRPMEDLPGTA